MEMLVLHALTIDDYQVLILGLLGSHMTHTEISVLHAPLALSLMYCSLKVQT